MLHISSEMLICAKREIYPGNGGEILPKFWAAKWSRCEKNEFSPPLLFLSSRRLTRIFLHGKKKERGGRRKILFYERRCMQKEERGRKGRVYWISHTKQTPRKIWRREKVGEEENWSVTQQEGKRKWLGGEGFANILQISKKRERKSHVFRELSVFSAKSENSLLLTFSPFHISACTYSNLGLAVLHRGAGELSVLGRNIKK